MFSRRTLLQTFTGVAAGAIGTHLSHKDLEQTKPTKDAAWTMNLTDTPTGRLTEATAATLLGTCVQTSPGLLTNGEVVTEAGSKVFRNHLPAGSLGELIASPKLPAGLTHTRISFDVRFSPGFDWRWGGKFGAGLVGVRPGAGIYSPTSGKSREDGWSTRGMWHGRGDDATRPFQGALEPIPAGQDNEAVTYIYAKEPSGGFSGYGHHAPVGHFQDGTWHSFSIEVKLNTPGKPDGRLVYQLDGKTGWESSSVRFRDSADIGTTAVLLDTHRGGGMSGSWPSSRDCWVDLRNMRVDSLAG